MDISIGIIIHHIGDNINWFRSCHTGILVNRIDGNKFRRNENSFAFHREGQITCICYALIGIPIFLLCLANISSILGDMFRFLYSTFLHCVCCCCRIYAHSRRPKNRGKQVNSVGFEYVGTTSADPTWPETYRQATDSKFYTDDSRDQSDAIDDDIDDEIDDVFSRMESRVPILVVITIIIGYICLGAIMFNYFEGWSMTAAVYFCYITLATIGFGDYVCYS